MVDPGCSAAVHPKARCLNHNTCSRTSFSISLPARARQRRGVVARLEAWLDGRPLDDRTLAAYLDSLREAGRAQATAAIVVAAVRHAARDAGRSQPDGPLTRQAIESFRRSRRSRRSLSPPQPRAASPLKSATASSPPVAARGVPAGASSAMNWQCGAAWSTERSSRWSSMAPCAAARWRRFVGPTSTCPPATTSSSSSPYPARRRTRRRTEPAAASLVDGYGAALRGLHAATKPAPADSVIGLGVHQINRRFAAACAATGLEGRRTPHGGRVGLAVELTARGASTRDVQLAGGWKNAGTVARYAARVTTGGGAVSRFMRGPGGGKPAD